MEADQDSWASASSHVSCWSRDDDSLSFESLSLTSLQSSDTSHSLITDGLQSVRQYEHSTIIRDVTVHRFNNWLYLLDDSGIVKWSHDNHHSSRVFQFPPYKHKLLMTIIYSDYFNVYFVLTTSGEVKVLNKDFTEVHMLELPVEQCKVSCVVFNNKTHQLAIGGLGGIKIFNYCQQQVNWKVIKPMAQYALVLDSMSVYTEGVWIRRVSVSSTMDWLIGISGCDVLIYAFNATLLLHMKRLHQAHVTSCLFLPLLKYFVTSSEDATVKVWSESGALITTFTSHLKEVMAMLVHPHCQWVIITCSLDGTIKQWNLITLQMEHSLTSSIGAGVMMGNVNKNCFYVTSSSSVELVEFNNVTQFWALSYCKMSQLSLQLRDNKVAQILARGVDGRLYSSDSTHLTTVLPSHQSSSVIGVAYCNDTHTLCSLTSDNELWAYSTQFNPAHRVSVVNGDEYLNVDTLLSSVLPTTIRLHYRVEMMSICACNSMIALGMIDGRVIILESNKDHELRKHGYLQTSVSPVMLLKFDKVLNTLMCASNYGDDAMCVQLWDAVNWNLSATIQCDNNSSLVDCAMLENCLMTGFKNGALSLFRLADSSTLNNFNDIEGVDDGEVISIQSSHSYSLFATTHSSDIIRLWNSHFIILVEVSTSSSLRACCFLPREACLILSLYNHLYTLMLDNILPHSLLILQNETMETTGSDSDSVIINDLSNSPDSLQHHLTGADVAMTTLQTTAEQQEQSDSIDDDESVISAAATETYQSPSVTPLPSVWLFPSLGPPSPTSSSGDLSHEDSATSLIVSPAEEPQGEYHYPYKGMDKDSQDIVATRSLTNNSNHLHSTMITGDQTPEYSKVTKVTGIKWQDMKTSRNKLPALRNRNIDLPKQYTANKNHKKKLLVTKIDLNKTSGIVSDANGKPVAMAHDKSNDHLMTSSSKHSKKLFHPLKGQRSSVDNVRRRNERSSKVNSLSSKVDKLQSRVDKQSSKVDALSSKADKPPSRVDEPSSKVDALSSKANKPPSRVDEPSSKVDALSSKANKPPSRVDELSSKASMTTIRNDKNIISVVVHKNAHSKTYDITTRSPDHSLIKNSASGTGWQMEAIERAQWRSCTQAKRHEDAQLRRLQRDNERRLIKSANHFKCFPSATNSKWQHYIERPKSVDTCHLHVLPTTTSQHNIFHEHKLNCHDYRLQLYEHEK